MPKEKSKDSMGNRKIIQITTGKANDGAYHQHILYALCDDGTLWAKHIWNDMDNESSWQLVSKE